MKAKKKLHIPFIVFVVIIALLAWMILGATINAHLPKADRLASTEVYRFITGLLVFGIFAIKACRTLLKDISFQRATNVTLEAQISAAISAYKPNKSDKSKRSGKAIKINRAYAHSFLTLKP